MFNRLLYGIAPALLVGIICALLGVTIVIRANRMRESALEFERLNALRDSLSVTNVRLRLHLAEMCNPLNVMNRLGKKGFTISSGGDIRFLLYDDPILQTGGSVSGHILKQLNSINDGWVERFFSSPISGDREESMPGVNDAS